MAKDRATGAKLAAEDGVDLLIMDDGLQNNTLAKDLCVLVVDGVAGFGNGKTIPAGPLREPVASILPRVDACIVIGGEAPKSLNHSNVLTATTETIYKDKLKRVLAFAGLGRPEKFFEALRSAGVNVVGGISFADHHPYSEHEINVLKSEAEHLDAALVTTKKDMVRLKALGLDKGIQVADLTLTFDDEAGVLALLKETLS